MRYQLLVCILAVFILMLCPLVFADTHTQFIDCQTAYTLEKNHYQFDFRFYQQGGALIGMSAGLTELLSIGASYGGTGIIGTGAIQGNPEPTFNIKYHLKNDGNFPLELALGYNGQGYGTCYREGASVLVEGNLYVSTRNFYQVNSTGFYIVASQSLDNSHIVASGGLNHSLEDDPGKPGIAAFVGLSYRASSQLGFTVEYNNLLHREINPEDVFEDAAALTQPIRRAGGELNLGLTFSPSPGFSLRMSLKDLTGVYSTSGNRTFQVLYSGEF